MAVKKILAESGTFLIRHYTAVQWEGDNVSEFEAQDWSQTGFEPVFNVNTDGDLEVLYMGSPYYTVHVSEWLTLNGDIYSDESMGTKKFLPAVGTWYWAITDTDPNDN